MRLKSIVLCSASAGGIVLGAVPATAQTTPPPVEDTGPAAPTDPAVEAQSTPAPDQGSPQTDDAVQTATGRDQTADEGEAIVVTGLRRSLQSAQNIKRNSDQIVDVIVAEDIGKLPDRTVSEALARVPGITVERAAGEAGDIFLRGLRDPATTYNGREIFTAEARNVAPQDFPAGSVAALEVFKSQTAEQIEGNLAGLINVRSRRPFDFKDREISGSLNATYADLAKDVAWNGNLLLSDRFDTGFGEIGVLVNASYTELNYNDNSRFNSGDFFGINPDPLDPTVFRDNLGNNIPGQTVRVPVVVGLFQNAGKRWRPAGNFAVQWRAADNLQVYVDGLYQGFRREVSDRSLFVPLFGAAAYTNVTIDDEGDSFGYPGSLTATSCCVPDGFQSATREETNTYQLAGGAIWENDRFRIGLDLARTKSKFDLSIYSFDYRLTAAPRVDVDFDTSGDGGVEFDFTGVDTTDRSNYLYRGFFDRQLIAKGDDYQARLDATLKDVTPWLRAVDVGLRFNDRDAGFSNAQRYSTLNGNTPLVLVPFRLDLDPYELTFRDGNQSGVDTLVLPTYDSIRGSARDLRSFAGFAQGTPEPGPFDQYDANEKGYTGYAQARYNFDLGATSIDGAIGLRAVKTKSRLNGAIELFQPDPDGTGPLPAPPSIVQPLTVNNNYTDYLPNFSIRARLTPQLQLRAAYTETRRRPDFGQLNPALRVDPPTAGGTLRTGFGGNPFLDPILSDNYDLSAEYYFSRTGFLALAVFRRNVTNFIVDAATEQDIPGVGVVTVRGPVNSDKGRLQGAEAQIRSFFDFDFVPEWARAFGTELNVTYIDNRLDAPPNFVDQSDIEFPDVSKWSYNLVGFYEQGPLTARLAYNYRSRYIQFFNNEAEATVGEFTKGVSRLDGSLSYTLNDNLTLAADVSNILGKPFRNYRGTIDGATFPRDVRYEERVYSVGIRARL
jgi:TonB-dependent receptor